MKVTIGLFGCLNPVPSSMMILFPLFYINMLFLGYADGYLKFKFSTIPKIVGDIFRWLIHNPRCPTVHNKKAVIEKEKVPTVIFSHGMSNQ